jgi:uncharacterized protein (TIGR02217 family)
MGFHELRIPTPDWGSAGGPGWDTTIIEGDSGAEVRISRLASPRHRYNLAILVKSYEYLAELKTFYMARKGALYGFRYKDWADYTSHADGQTAPTPTDQLCGGVADGSNNDFQLQKVYTNDYVTRTRTITKPVANTVIVALDGVTQASGFSYNTTTGVITFTTPPANGVAVTAGFEFDVPVRFDKSADEWLQINMDNYGHGSTPPIILVELIDEKPFYDDIFYGGAASLAGDGIYDITVNMGRVIYFDPSGAAMYARLPNPVDLPLGGPYWHFVVKASDPDITVRDHLNNTIGTVSEGNDGRMVFLGIDENSDKVWILA